MSALPLRLETNAMREPSTFGAGAQSSNVPSVSSPRIFTS
jgi:hypothetical protein